MRIKIASRIFEPEPSAASFRLSALATAFVKAGHEVIVDTVRPTKSQASHHGDDARPYRVRRHRVLRDRSGYVRGYLQYLSYDVPLFLRVLFGRRADLYIVEPPPTSGFFIRLATSVRRIPYAYYAADIWSDAAQQTGASSFIIRVVAALEKWVWKGAKPVLSVSPGVSKRLRELVPNLQPLEVGNGIDTKRFLAKIDPHDGLEQRLNTFVYAGTASEWHGADIFIRAFASRRDELTDYTLQFIGGGSEVDNLRYLARRLGVGQRVSFEPSLRPEQLGPRLANCTLALASLKPHSGYDFAFPTKLYSAAACGAPLLHTGGGPGADFVLQRVDGRSIGEAVAFNEVDVAAALVHAVQVPPDARSVTRRLAVRRWAQLNVDIQSVAENAVNALIPLEGTRS